MLGERSVVEGVPRTATLRAVTAAQAVAVPAPQIDPATLQELAAGRRGSD